MLRDLRNRTSDRAVWILAMLVVLALVGVELLLNSIEARRMRDLQASARGITALSDALSAEIGYVGLIHNFKNCLIRAGEPRYCDAARANAIEASRLIDSIERRASDLDLDLALVETRRMVDAYGGRVDAVQQGHRAGDSISQIDERVRFDDRPAHAEITQGTRIVAAELDRRISSLTSTASFRLVFVLLLGSTILLLLFGFQRSGERKRAHLLDEAGKRLQTVIETVPNGIVGLNEDRQVLIVNAAARRMFHREKVDTPFAWPDEALFLSEENLKPLEASADPITRASAGLKLHREVNLIALGEKEQRRYVSISSAQVDAPSSAVRTVMVFEDVTEQRAQREQINRSQRLDALGQLTGGLAHDFNNLLATIQYSIELAQLGARPDKLGDYLTNALGAVRSGADLTRRLLAFAKRQPGLARSRPVEEAMSDLMKLARPVIEERVDIVITPPDEELWVYCDQAQLENALLNLLLNSRDAIISSGVGDRIEISARRVLANGADGKDGYVELAVADNGPGMSEEVRRRAVDPFFSTKAAGSGSGLGLSMVYGFAMQSNGQMKIESRPGDGATMRLLLPRGAPSTHGAGAGAGPRPPVGGGERVMLVEDESGLRIAMAEMLRALNYQVVSAVDGAAALELLQQGEKIDVLLTDIVMPGGVSGFDLASELRQTHPDLKILYMSGYAGFTGREMGELVAPLLQKPCSAYELGAALRQTLAKKPARQGS